MEIKKEKENINNINNQKDININNNNQDLNLNLDLPELEDDENLINFMENLDYDKYLKNQEVREALFLLKNKVEKEKENNPEDDNNKENNEDENKEENNNENNEEKNEINLPPIDPKVGLIHDRDWDGKNLEEDNEYKKKKLADKILKLDKVKEIVDFIFIYFLEFENCTFSPVN